MNVTRPMTPGYALMPPSAFLNSTGSHASQLNQTMLPQTPSHSQSASTIVNPDKSLSLSVNADAASTTSSDHKRSGGGKANANVIVIRKGDTFGRMDGKTVICLRDIEGNLVCEEVV